MKTITEFEEADSDTRERIGDYLESISEKKLDPIIKTWDFFSDGDSTLPLDKRFKEN